VQSRYTLVEALSRSESILPRTLKRKPE
jgi:hypothetical protein